MSGPLLLPPKAVVFLSWSDISVPDSLWEGGMFECHVSYPQLVSRCFEPGQPQKITSGLNTNFSLSPSYSFHKSIITPQVIFAQTAAQILSTISERNTRNIITHVLEPISFPRALSTGTCIQQGDSFYSAGLHRNRCQPQPTQHRLGRGLEG